jgi:hypothetical protein
MELGEEFAGIATKLLFERDTQNTCAEDEFLVLVVELQVFILRLHLGDQNSCQKPSNLT